MSYEKRFQYSYEMNGVWIGQIRRAARNRYSANGCFKILCVFSTYECIYTKIKYNAMWTTFSNSFFLDKLWLHLKNLVHNIIMRNIDEIWKKTWIGQFLCFLKNSCISAILTVTVGKLCAYSLLTYHYTMQYSLHWNSKIFFHRFFCQTVQ
jgi:ABC-type glycerol-3-phosphate transport system permease component